MKILITNNRLDTRPGGAETFVQDLARGLQEQGHSVMAYTSDLANRPRMMEGDLVPITTDLSRLSFRPDIVHGQHHLDAMTAVGALPEVPALYHCHGANWLETQPVHPRIYKYLAVSRTLVERMRIESNLAESQVELILNSVNLDRFTTIRSLPERPKRALFYNKVHHPASPTVAAVKEAATRHGLELDFLGRLFGELTHRPEERLPLYDIVFASGRSAIDALASGCAVIVLGRNSCGPMVCASNYEHFRSVNFSVAANVLPASADAIAGQIGSYSAEMSASITRRLREDADSRRMVARLIEIYQEVMALHERAPSDWRREALAMSDYLRTLVPFFKGMDHLQQRKGIPFQKVHALQDLSSRLDTILRDFKWEIPDEPPEMHPDG